MVVYSTPYMMNNITYGTFFLFGASVVCGIIFTWFLIPETKGVLLEDMDVLFSQKGNASSWRKLTDEIIEARRRNVLNGVIEDKDKQSIAHEEKV